MVFVFLPFLPTDELPHQPGRPDLRGNVFFIELYDRTKSDIEQPRLINAVHAGIKGEAMLAAILGRRNRPADLTDAAGVRFYRKAKRPRESVPIFQHRGG